MNIHFKKLLCLCLVLTLLTAGLPMSVQAEDTTTYELVTAPAAGVAYKLAMDRNEDSLYYFNGTTESSSVNYRLGSTTDVTASPDVYLEEADGGYRLYFMDGSTKTYIRVYEYNTSSAKGSLELTTSVPSEYYTYDSTANTLVTTGTVGSYYMGTHDSYTTFSASNTSYITGTYAAYVDVSQFPARLYQAVDTQVFSGASVVLDSILSVRFYTPYVGGKVTVTVGDGEAQEITASETSAVEGCQEYCVDVFAQDMTKSMIASLYDDNGSILCKQTFYFSNYVAAIEGSASEASWTKALAGAALTYCQYAAKLKGNYSGEMNTLEAIPEGAFTDYPFALNGAAGISIHAYLDEACQLRMRLPAEYGTGYQITVDGEETQLTASGDSYLCATDQILPQHYGQAHTFQIQKDGTEIYSGSYSVLSYLGRCLETNAGTAEQQDLMKAMYHYYDAAATAANPQACTGHTDDNGDDYCEYCGALVLTYVDFYTINDLHGKFMDSDSQIGVDELTTYLTNAQQSDDHAILLSSGDMWQGSAEGSLTHGLLLTDWMNALDFAAMTPGNHEFDWGSGRIYENVDTAQFPMLAINIYSNDTGKQLDCFQSSVMVECNGAQIGIIGAIGDCYSSISSEKVTDVYFKTGDELTALVKAESESLRAQGADFILYLLHDGYGSSTGTSAGTISDNSLSSYYDIELSDGYVDLVFEAHTHQQYLLQDSHDVYHLQNKGDNTGGISHVEILINSATGEHSVTQSNLITTGVYSGLEGSSLIQELLAQYPEEIAKATETLGTNAAVRSSSTLNQLVADQYYAYGLELWGDSYDIVLGGGYINSRSPYSLSSGDVTYGNLFNLYPFDNELVLCSISGQKLQDRFFNNSSYSISYGTYGEQVKANIDVNATYYIVVDSYTSQYTSNGLTEIARCTEEIYARDFLADYIRDGNLE